MPACPGCAWWDALRPLLKQRKAEDAPRPRPAPQCKTCRELHPRCVNCDAQGACRDCARGQFWNATSLAVRGGGLRPASVCAPSESRRLTGAPCPRLGVCSARWPGLARSLRGGTASGASRAPRRPAPGAGPAPTGTLRSACASSAPPSTAAGAGSAARQSATWPSPLAELKAAHRRSTHTNARTLPNPPIPPNQPSPDTYYYSSSRTPHTAACSLTFGFALHCNYLPPPSDPPACNKKRGSKFVHAVDLTLSRLCS